VFTHGTLSCIVLTRWSGIDYTSGCKGVSYFQHIFVYSHHCPVLSITVIITSLNVSRHKTRKVRL